MTNQDPKEETKKEFPTSDTNVRDYSNKEEVAMLRMY